MALYSENYTKHKNTLCVITQRFERLKMW